MSDVYVWPEFIAHMSAMGGAGTAGSPYTISTIYALQAMMFDRQAHYRLAANIDGLPSADWDDGCGFIPFPYGAVCFPHEADQDVDVTGTWGSYPALVPNQLHTNVNDWHLYDAGDIETVYDWFENDGDDSYVELVNQILKRIGVNSSNRRLPINMGGTLDAMVTFVAKKIGSSALRARPCMKVGGTWYNGGSYRTMDDRYNPYSWRFGVNPATSAAWTREQLLGTAGSDNLEAWGVDVEGSASVTFRLTKIQFLPRCQYGVDPGYHVDDVFIGYLDGNGKTISDVSLNGTVAVNGGLFGRFGGEAYDFIINHAYHDTPSQTGAGDCGVFAGQHLGYAHDIEIRNSDLYLMTGATFACEIQDDGYTVDGLMCDNIKVSNTVIHNCGGDVAGFAVSVDSLSALVAKVQKSYCRDLIIDIEGSATPADNSGFVNWIGDDAEVSECWCSGEITTDIGAWGFCVEVFDAVVINCYARMKLTEITGDLAQAVTLGGFCRALDADGTIEKCHAIALVMSSPNSLRAAFLLDDNMLGTLSDCHVDAQATPHDLDEAAITNTTAEMKDEDTFTNWDFVDIWSRDDSKNDGYPYLQDAPLSGPPQVHSCTPSVVHRGDTNEEVVLTGFNFTLVSLLSFHAGITVVDFDIDSDTQITAHINVAEDAPLGLRDIDATSIFGTGTLVDGIEVQEPPPPAEPPEVHSCNPTWGSPGASGLEVVVDGLHFTGATSVDFHAGVTVNSFVVDGDTQITASIDIAEEASVGYRDVDVTTPNGTGVLVGGFQVTESGPTPPAGPTGTIAIFRAVPISISCVS